MKVAFFIGSLNRGGAEILVLDTLRKRNTAPFESILIYRNDGDLSDEYRATGVPMFRIKPTGTKLGYVPRLRRLLKKEKVDILHTQTLWNGLIGILCTNLSRVKLVASFHGFLSSKKSKLIAHFVMWGANASVFVSNYEREWFINRIHFAPQKRCHVVYNGIDFSKFDREYPVPDFLQGNELGIPETLTMATVGNFVLGRSQDFLCQALKAFKDSETRNFKFYFVGRRSSDDPERYDKCVRYCTDNGLLNSSVCFLGSRSDVPAILQHLDAFVYSSDCDTFGIAVVEAMAMGVPVIVNDWEVMKEITDNGELATLYKNRDVSDCTAKLIELTKHLEGKRVIAMRAANVVRQRFSIENHIHSLFRVYQATQ